MRVLAGIQPSGALHIGNYFGSIKQLVDEQNNNEVFAFIANWHAQTSFLSSDTANKAKTFRQLVRNCTIDFLSLGIDPHKTYFWLQSDIKEVLELYWILSSFTAMGLLQRAHSYKDKLVKGINANHSLFSYPVLMAADILLYDSEIVPVGKDQVQHLEITRDIALRFNQAVDDDILTLPEAKIEDNIAIVTGIDGQKMSKSYGNTIDIFCEEKQLQQQINKIITDSTPLEQPKDYNNCNIYAIAKIFLDEDSKKLLQQRYQNGNEGYGHFKKYLKELIFDYFSSYREKRAYYVNNPQEIEQVINDGANKVRAIAQEKMALIRDRLGLNKIYT